MELHAQHREFEAQKEPTQDNIARLEGVITEAVQKDRAAEDLKEPEKVSPIDEAKAAIEDKIAELYNGYAAWYFGLEEDKPENPLTQFQEIVRFLQSRPDIPSLIGIKLEPIVKVAQDFQADAELSRSYEKTIEKHIGRLTVNASLNLDATAAAEAHASGELELNLLEGSAHAAVDAGASASATVSATGAIALNLDEVDLSALVKAEAIASADLKGAGEFKLTKEGILLKGEAEVGASVKVEVSGETKLVYQGDELFKLGAKTSVELGFRSQSNRLQCVPECA